MSLAGFIQIKKVGKDSKEMASTHFSMYELRCKSPDAPNIFLFDQKLLLAGEYLRTILVSRILPLSTFRTDTHNDNVPGAVNDSQHEEGRAFDITFLDNREENILRLRHEVETRGPIYQALRKIGINGFGFYDTFVHLDTRTTPGYQVDNKHGRFAMWNEQKDLKKKMFRLTCPTCGQKGYLPS